MTYQPDGKWLVMAGGFPFVKVFNLLDSTSRKLDLHLRKSSYQVEFLSNEKFASIGTDTIVIYDLKTDRAINLARTNPGCKTIEGSDDGKLLVFTDASQSLNLYNTESGEYQFKEGIRPGMAITALAVKEMEEKGSSRFTIAIGYSNGSINILSIQGDTVKERRLLDFHHARINQLVFTPDGKHLFASSHDNLVSVWDQDYELSLIFDDHGSWATSLAFYEKNNQLLVGYYNGDIRFYNLDPQAYIDQLCNKLRWENLDNSDLEHYQLEEYQEQINLCN